MQSQSVTHVTLLGRIKDRADRNAWQEFNDRYGELIRGFARRRGLQAADCDDVAQDVLLSLSQAMERFEYDPGKGKFRSYLKTVTLRAIFRRNRRKGGEIDLEHIEEATAAASRDQQIEEAWEMEWRDYHLRQAMKTVELNANPSDVRAFKRYAIEGRDAQDTAAALELSLDQVYQAKSRITRKLQDIIEQQVREEG